MAYNYLYQYLIEDLVCVLKDKAYLSIVIDNRIKKSNLNLQDKKVYTKIMYGVVEKKLLLDYYLQPLVKGMRVKPIPRQALRVGAYVIDYLNIQNHFIVNEIIEVLKKIDFHSASFVNAVLRKYLESPKPDLTKLPLLERKSLELSIPLDLLKLLYNQYQAQVFDFYQTPTSINTYRINTLKTRVEEVKQVLDNNKIEYTINNLCLKTSSSLINHSLFKEGKIIAQDESSMMVAEMVNPKPGSMVLDTCSAPGGKSLYMAALMNNEGYILACDVSDEKINKINSNAQKLDIDIIQTKVCDATNTDYQQLFDNVLVDAPCSGLGTINHKPDLKYRLTLKDISDIINLQQQILDNAYKYVKKEGYLTYSTCTINKEENEKQINNFLIEHKEFEKVQEIVILPSNTSDGFYICKLKKQK